MDSPQQRKADPTGLLAVMAREDVPQRCIAAMADISDSAFSSILSGRSTTSTETKLLIFAALKFCGELRRNSTVPVDFRKIAAIKELWKAQQKKDAEREVIRQASELQLQVEVAE